MKIPKDKYKYILENFPVACVDLILCQNKKVLLVKRKNKPLINQFWFPGGRILKNEKTEDAVLRKAKEELGINIEIIRMIGVYDTFFPDGVFEDLKNGTHTINISFLVVPKDKDPKIKIDGTSLDFKWTDLSDESLSSYVKKVIVDANIPSVK